MTFTVLVPNHINERLFHKYLQQQRGGEIAELKNHVRLERPAFEFTPVPGPTIDGLSETRLRLEAIEAIDDVFALPHQT